MRSVRLLPLLAFAALCLFALKSLGLVLSGGYMLTGSAPAGAQSAKDEKPAETAPAETAQAAREADRKQEADANPDANAREQDAGLKKETKSAAESEGGSGVAADGPVMGASKSELAVLQSLSERRKSLDKLQRELTMRENLLKAAEQKVQARINELKAIEGRIENELKQRDEKREAEYARLVKMYATMKPKDAARIFNRLDMDVLIGMVRLMKPRSMSAILAAMDPAAAERLTLELADQGRKGQANVPALPKISSADPG